MKTRKTGWTIEEFEQASPPLPNRIELINGTLYPKSLNRSWHSQVVRQLANAIEMTASDNWMVLTGIGIRIDSRTRPEPDIMVVDRQARDPKAASYAPEVVQLAIDVGSQKSAEQDYTDKPALYASAGIPYLLITINGNGGGLLGAMELQS